MEDFQFSPELEKELERENDLYHEMIESGVIKTDGKVQKQH